MTQEERDAIRARCEAATSGPWEVTNDNNIMRSETGEIIVESWHTSKNNPDESFIAHARQDIPALLDALDEAKAKYEHINNFDNTQSIKLIADRNHWKARSEALERAIYGVCEYCEYYVDANSVCDACTPVSCNWQFDQERFTNKELDEPNQQQ